MTKQHLYYRMAYMCIENSPSTVISRFSSTLSFCPGHTRSRFHKAGTVSDVSFSGPLAERYSRWVSDRWSRVRIQREAPATWPNIVSHHQLVQKMDLKHNISFNFSSTLFYCPRTRDSISASKVRGSYVWYLSARLMFLCRVAAEPSR